MNRQSSGIIEDPLEVLARPGDWRHPSCLVFYVLCIVYLLM